MSGTFFERLRACATELDYIQKTGQNKAQNYDYVTEAHVKERVKPLLGKHGLVIIDVDYEPLMPPTPDACVLKCVVVVGEDGPGRVTFRGVGAGNNRGKAPMAACAAALKYALTSGFLIPTGSDPEATDEKGQDTAGTPAVQKPQDMSPAKGTATASTSAALKAAGAIAEAATVAALDAMLEDFSKAVVNMTEADANTVRGAFRDKRKKLLEGAKV